MAPPRPRPPKPRGRRPQSAAALTPQVFGGSELGFRVNSLKFRVEDSSGV